MERANGRKWDELRPIRIENAFLLHPEGSVLMAMGNTKVICTATLEDKVPPFLRNSGRGWLTAEYGMLPRSTHTRMEREATRGKIGGRTHEIQRLIGRSLRAVTDLNAFGEKTITVDCDVIQADGGTRTAAITGGFIAVVELFRKMMQKGQLNRMPIIDGVAAVSVGIIDETLLLDLDYEEDSQAQVDMNFVVTGRGLFIEVQGTAEKTPFDRGQLNGLTDLAVLGIRRLREKQTEILGDIN
ncbi:MAG: ribonuclease PH [Deltaproteobacteria bacterium]|nr:ribonuclease PH [Deltaproteobacteria bacterium]